MANGHTPEQNGAHDEQIAHDDSLRSVFMAPHEAPPQRASATSGRQSPLAKQIERHIQQSLEQVGRQVRNLAVAESSDRLFVSGVVASERDRGDIEQLARAVSPGWRIENMIEVEWLVPAGMEAQPDTQGATGDSGDRSGTDQREDAAERFADERDLLDSTTDTETLPDELEPDFVSQPLETNDSNVSNDSVADLDPPDEPDPTYFAPTDPVITSDEYGMLLVDNGFAPADDTDEGYDRSAEDNQPGDQALIAAIQRELRRDALTTDLRIEVGVSRGVARLRGAVPELEDAENAEAVAARVAGVLEVLEELDVATMDQPSDTAAALQPNQ
ncbi:MAG: BON domain-containing protein [Ktedonobacterales bacterium]